MVHLLVILLKKLMALGMLALKGELHPVSLFFEKDVVLQQERSLALLELAVHMNMISQKVEKALLKEQEQTEAT